MGDWKLIIDDRARRAPARALTKAEGENAKSGSARRQARQLAAATADGIGASATMKLFNLAQDPGEDKDVAAEHPEKVKELRAAYDQLAAQAVPPKGRTPSRPTSKRRRCGASTSGGDASAWRSRATVGCDASASECRVLSELGDGDVHT